VSPPPAPEAMLIQGRNVIPVRLDKRPAIPSWKQFQRERVSVAQVKEWTRKLKPKAWAVIPKSGAFGASRMPEKPPMRRI